MGIIANKAKEYFLDPCMVKFKDYILEIESQIGALRMENQVQYLNAEALRQEIQDLKMDNIRGGSISSPEEPQTSLPPEQWERGDVLSCVSGRTGRKEVGIFHHYTGRNENLGTADIMGYWQKKDGMISNVIDYRGLSTEKVTFEFRPEK